MRDSERKQAKWVAFVSHLVVLGPVEEEAVWSISMTSEGLRIGSDDRGRGAARRRGQTGTRALHMEHRRSNLTPGAGKAVLLSYDCSFVSSAFEAAAQHAALTGGLLHLNWTGLEGCAALGRQQRQRTNGRVREHTVVGHCWTVRCAFCG